MCANSDDVENEEKPEIIVGVKLSSSGDIHFFDADGIELAVGDQCVVDGQEGAEYALVKSVKQKTIKTAEEAGGKHYSKVLRRASWKDNQQLIKNCSTEKDAYKICKEKIELHRLARRMKATKGLKGNKYLWGDMNWVRDITFTKAEKINLGEMTNHL